MSNNQDITIERSEWQNVNMDDFISFNRNSENLLSSSQSSLSTIESLSRRVGESRIDQALAHNRNCSHSIRSSATGEVEMVELSGSKSKHHRSNSSWWAVYNYGMRIGNVIHCTVSYTETTGCKKGFESRNKSSTSFLRHLFNEHHLNKDINDELQNQIQYEKDKILNSSNITLDPITQEPIKVNSPDFAYNIVREWITPTNWCKLDSLVEYSKKSKISTLAFNRKNFLILLVKFILKNKLPFNFVNENSTFQGLLHFSLLPKTDDESLAVIKIPSRTFITEELKKMYIEKKDEIKDYLKQHNYFSFTSDIWKSPNKVYFMSVTCHFIELPSWKPQQITLALRDISGLEHTGKSLALTFLSVLEEYNITSKLFCLTTDNASNNSCMAKSLQEISNERKDFVFNADENWIPCFAHIINLVCQEIPNHEIVLHASNENEDNFSAEKRLSKSEAVSTPVNRLRLGCYKIKNHDKLKSAYIECRDNFKLPKVHLKTDCKTRWNSTKSIISRFLLVKQAYDHAINQDDLVKELCSLSSDDVKYLETLNSLLSIFEAVTIWLCSQKYTTINRTIVLVNSIVEHLESFIQDNEQNKPEFEQLVVATEKGLAKLAKYYKRTDKSQVFASSTMCDAMPKISYWADEGWGEALCEEQEQKCREYFKMFLKDYYLNQQLISSTSIQAVNQSTSDTSNDITFRYSLESSNITNKKFILGVPKKRLMSNQGNQSIKKRPITKSIDDLISRNNELEIYIHTNDEIEFPFEGLEAEEADNISESVDSDNCDFIVNESIEETGYNGEEAYESSIFLFKDKSTNIYMTNCIKLRTGFEYSHRPLSYWQQKQYMYPTLSLFAAKILGVCSTSVPSERLFSQSKRIINSERSKLRSDTGEAYVLLSSWEREYPDRLT